MSTRHAFEIEIPQGRTCDFFLKTTYPPHWFFSESLHGKDSYFQRASNRRMALAVLLGIILSILLYNLFLVLFSRDPIYWLYTGYVFFNLIYQITFTGIPALFSNFSSTEIYIMSLSYAVIISQWFLFFFFVRFLNIQLWSNTAAKVFTAVPFLLVFIHIANLFNYTDLYTFALIFNVINNFFTMILLSVLVYGVIKKRTGAWILLSAFLLYLAGIALYIISTTFGTIKSNPFIDNASQAGVAIEMIVLSIALAYRINDLRKSKEQAQKESIEALEKADQSKDEFMRTIAHELRSPLQAIMTMTENTGTGNLHETYPLVHSGARRLSGLVNNLIDYGRIRHIGLTVEPEPVLLYPVAHRVLELNRVMAPEAVEFNLQMPEDLTVMADPDRIEQVLQNLVANAIRAPASGRSAHSFNRRRPDRPQSS